MGQLLIRLPVYTSKTHTYHKKIQPKYSNKYNSLNWNHLRFALQINCNIATVHFWGRQYFPQLGKTSCFAAWTTAFVLCQLKINRDCIIMSSQPNHNVMCTGCSDMHYKPQMWLYWQNTPTPTHTQKKRERSKTSECEVTTKTEKHIPMHKRNSLPSVLIILANCHIDMHACLQIVVWELNLLYWLTSK